MVLAINARLLYKNTQPFEHFLLEFPEIQILVWTGSTEPPISERKVAFIRNRFATCGHCDRVGFDCKVRLRAYLIYIPPIIRQLDLITFTHIDRLPRRTFMVLCGMFLWIFTACMHFFARF